MINVTPTRIDHNGGYSQRQKALMRTVEDRNEAIVREAFDALFNKRDYAAAERFWSPDHIQHSAHIPSRPGEALRSGPEPPGRAEARSLSGLPMCGDDFPEEC
ncbi:hypothetical protein [Streptomyces mirabilis]|uniref:hypothetical protein n=1 Tax=Streptomyces mirabilis TaxID=68239 RepID=UPI00366102D8